MRKLTYRHQVAEHEAAHVVVARHLGVPVVRCVMRGRWINTGGTTTRRLTTPENAAMISMAGYTWERYYMPHGKLWPVLVVNSYMLTFYDRVKSWKMLLYGVRLGPCRKRTRRILGLNQNEVINAGNVLNRRGWL